MENLLVSFVITISFFINGYWFYFALGRSQKTFLEVFVLSAWAGLGAFIILSTSLYFSLWHVPFKRMAIPIFALLSILSLITFCYFKNHRIVVKRLEITIIAISIIVILLMSSPFIDLNSLTFYFSNNGEFINYAFLSDVVKYHGPSIKPLYPVTPLFTESREGTVALLTALFSVLFGKSTLFIIQPLSYAITWLVFLSLGLVFLQLHNEKNKTNYWHYGVILTVYLLAVVSAANLQLCIMSFMSQYIDEALVFGLIAFIFLTKLEHSADRIKCLFVFGLGFSAIGCVYPEQLILTMMMISFLFIGLSDQLSLKQVSGRIAILLGSFVLAAILGNVFLYKLLTTSAVTVAKLSLGNYSPGWDIFGVTEHGKKLFGNLTGLSNLFFYHHSPLTISYISLLILLSVGMLKSVHVLITKKWKPFHVLLLFYLGYFFVAIAGLLWMQYRNYISNYLAVKFILTWILLQYVALAFVLCNIRLKVMRFAVIILGVAVGASIIIQSTIFTKGLRLDASHTRYTEKDSHIFKKINVNNVYVVADRYDHFFNLLGGFLILQKNVWPRIIPVFRYEQQLHDRQHLDYPFLLFFELTYPKWKMTSKNIDVFQTVYSVDNFTFVRKIDISK